MCDICHLASYFVMLVYSTICACLNMTENGEVWEMLPFIHVASVCNLTEAQQNITFLLLYH